MLALCVCREAVLEILRCVWAGVKLMEHFKWLEEAAGNGHVVHGLRICEGFLKPISQNCTELFRLEKTCRDH